ncbi:MAG: hypothetical protein ABJN34_06615 [Litoreibacter sp.]|uniref:hypothetical protein n=1 Tax=Litoreibacter sp. TaxID=1969459 RepID=UPI0032972633
MKSKSVSIRKIIDDERKFLMAGNFSGLKEILRNKEAILEEIESKKSNLEVLDAERLKQELAENQDLYLSVKVGISSALKRVEELIESRGSLKVYNSKGTQVFTCDSARGIRV